MNDGTSADWLPFTQSHKHHGQNYFSNDAMGKQQLPITTAWDCGRFNTNNRRWHHQIESRTESD